MESSPVDIPPSPAARPRIDVSLTGIMAAFGLAMVVFVPGKGRVFGIAALALTAAVFVRDAYFRQPRGARALLFLRRAYERGGRALATLPFDTARWAIGLIGLVLLAAAGLLWRDPPMEFAWFAGAIGAILVVAVLVWPWMENSPQRILLQAAACLLAIAAIASYTWMVAAYSINFPFFDEYISTLPIAILYEDWTRDEMMAALSSSHFSHIILTTRLLTILDYLLFGELNFLHLVWVSYAFFLGTVAIIYAKLPVTLRNPLYFAPFVLLLFHPQFHQLSLWGFSPQHFGCFFFALVTFACLERGQWASWLALVGFVAAAYSFALGVFVGLIAVAYLLDAGRNREAIYWSIPLGLIVTRQFNAPELFSDNTLNALGYVRATLGGKILYMLEFSGSFATLGYFSDFMNSLFTDANSVEYIHARWIARIAGSVVLACFAYISFRQYWKRNFAVYGLLLLTVLAAIATAEQRNVELPNGNSTFLSRYTINSVFMVGLVYLALADLHTRLFQRIVPFVVVLCAVFCGLTYKVTLPYARNHAADLRFTAVQASNAIYQGTRPNLAASPLFSFEALAKSVEMYVYTIPEKAIARDVLRDGVPVDLATVPEHTLPWRLVNVGENASTYTFMVGPKDPDAAKRTMPRILLKPARGEALTLPLLSLDVLPGHLGYLQQESGPQVDRLVSVAKAGLPAGPLSVWLYTEGGAVRGRETTGVTLPTVTVPASVLASAAPTVPLFHAVGRRLYSVEHPEGWSTVKVAPESATIPFTGQLTVEAVVRVSELAPSRNAKLWNYTSTQPDARALQLSLLGNAFVLLGNDGTQWNELMRIAATPHAWNWIAVSLDGQQIYQYVIAYDAATQALGPVQFDAKPVTQPYFKDAGVLELGTGIDPANVAIADIFEVRMVGDAMTAETISGRWPVFRAPAR